MTETRRTEKLIDFRHPFQIGALVTPLEAGTYRLTLDEPAPGETADASEHTAAGHLDIPAVGHKLGRSQSLQVTVEEIEEALRADAEKGVSAFS